MSDESSEYPLYLKVMWGIVVVMTPVVLFGVISNISIISEQAGIVSLVFMVLTMLFSGIVVIGGIIWVIRILITVPMGYHYLQLLLTLGLLASIASFILYFTLSSDGVFFFDMNGFIYYGLLGVVCNAFLLFKYRKDAKADLDYAVVDYKEKIKEKRERKLNELLR